MFFIFCLPPKCELHAPLSHGSIILASASERLPPSPGIWMWHLTTGLICFSWCDVLFNSDVVWASYLQTLSQTNKFPVSQVLIQKTCLEGFSFKSKMNFKFLWCIFPLATNLSERLSGGLTSSAINSDALPVTSIFSQLTSYAEQYHSLLAISYFPGWATFY